jgi:tape measure domain-containing protein
VRDTGDKIRRETDKASSGFAGMEKAIGLAKTTLAAFGVTVGLGVLVKLGTDAAQAAIKLQSLTTTLKTLTGGAEGAQASLAFLRETANRLGIDLASSTQGFVQLTAAARGTRLEGSGTQQVFADVSAAVRAMGLTTQQTSGVFTALQQILSKGKVQTQEVVLQLGNDLPGALQISARAMGVTTQEFTKLLEDGVIPATEFVQKLGAQLRKELGGGAEEASKQAQAAFARLGNETLALAQNMGKGILALLQPLAEWTTAAIAAVNKVSAARQAEEERLKRANPLAFTPPAAAPAVADVGGERVRTAEQFRLAQQQLQDQLQELVRAQAAARASLGKATGSPFFSSTFVAPSQLQAEIEGRIPQIQKLEERIKSLDASYKEFLKTTEKVAKQSETGFPDETPLVPKAEDIEKFRGLLKELDQAKKEASIRPSLFPDILPKDAVERATAIQKEAEERVKVLRKSTEDLAELFQKTPGFLETLEPKERQALVALQKEYAGAQREVVRLGDATDALKEKTKQEEQASRQAASEAKRLLEDRQALIDKIVQGQGKGFTLRDPAAEQINADIVYFNKLLSTETGPRLEAVKTILDELGIAKLKAFGSFPLETLEGVDNISAALQQYDKDLTASLKVTDDYAQAVERLNIIAGRGISIFEERRRKLDAEIKSLEQAMGGPSALSLEAAAAGRKKILEDETKHTETELKKQQRDYEQFAAGVQRSLSDKLFDVLSGKVESFKDLLGSIKDTFLRVLADMVAAAAISGLFNTSGGKPSFLSFLTGTSGTGTTAAGVSGNGGGGSVLGSLFQAGGYAKQLYNLYGAIFGTGAATGAAALGATAPTAFYGTQAASAAGLFAPSAASGGSFLAGLGSTSLGGGVTLGAAASGVGYGVGTGLLASQLLSLAGLHGTANTTLSGATGGAVAGTVIAPGIGTIVGAVVGALGGFLAGFLGKEPAPPGFTAPAGSGTVPQFGTNQLGQVIQTTGFRPQVGGAALTAQGLQSVQNALHDVTNQVISPVIDTLRQFPKEFQYRATEQLNNLGESLKVGLGTIKFSGEDFAEQFKTYLEKDLPDAVHRTFDPFVALLNQLKPVFDSAQQLLQALKQQEAQILGTVAGVRANLEEAGLSNLAIFKRRQEQLSELLGQFAPGTPENQRIVLGQQITSLVSALGSQGTALFRGAGDDEGLQVFKQGLFDALTQVEQDTRNVFGSAEQQAQEQIDILTGSLSAQQGMESLLEGVNVRLDQIAQLLSPVGSFQTEIGEVRRIPRTGMALVHQGELIGRPVAGGSIVVNVDARGATDPGAVGRTTAAAIRSQLRAMQQAGRYRQGGGI